MSEIIKSLNAAYKECGYVQKQKTQGLNYSYAGEAALIEALRPVLLAHGVVVYQSGIENVKHDQYTTAKGTVQNRVVATFYFTFAHISGESIRVSAMGEGVDAGDKAAYKANTGALKYALRQTLLIETGDDPDHETPEPRAEKKVFTDAEKEQAAKGFLDGLALTLKGESLDSSYEIINTNKAKIRAAGAYPSLASRAADYLAVINESL